jgi:hypothetical protein
MHGQHSGEILAELGYSGEDIERFAEAGVIAPPKDAIPESQTPRKEPL